MATASQRLVTEAALDAALDALPDSATALSGTGSPEGVVAAPEGTIYIDTSDTVATERRIYIKRQGSTSTGWALIAGTQRFDITAQATNLTSGKITLIIHGGFVGVQFASVIPAVAGTCEFYPSSGILAPFVPSWSNYLISPNLGTGATPRNLLVAANGRIVALSAATTDNYSGAWWWPLTRSLPATMPGTEI